MVTKAWVGRSSQSWYEVQIGNRCGSYRNSSCRNSYDNRDRGANGARGNNQGSHRLQRHSISSGKQLACP